MELDPRIKKGYRPLSYFDADFVWRPFIGQTGYFGYQVSDFKELNPTQIFNLCGTVDGNFDAFNAGRNCHQIFQFFLPEAWVMKPESIRQAEEKAEKIAEEVYNLIRSRVGDEDLQEMTDHILRKMYELRWKSGDLK